MREKSKKNNKRLLLVVLLLIVTIGYATLQTNLTINGTSKINNATWNVHFETVTPTPGSVTIDTNDNTQYAARIDTNDNTKVGFSVLLNEPGDFYEFTVKAVNSGSIDAMVDSVTKTLKIDNVLQNSIPDWLTYTATYSDGVEIVKNHILAHESFETYKIRVEFKRDITNAQLELAVGKTLTLDFEVNYIQKGEGAIVVSHSLNGTYYSAMQNGIYTFIGRTVPNNTKMFTTPALALADLKQSTGGTIDRPFYLKHIISNNVIDESYVGYVISEDMVETARTNYIENCNNDQACIDGYDGMKAGTYYLKGQRLYEAAGDDWVCDDECEVKYYETNKATLINSFGNSNCRERIDYYGIDDVNCNAAGLNAIAYSDAYIASGDDLYSCIISYTGDPYCNMNS